MTKLYVCEISNLIKEVKADSNALENYFDKLGKQRIEHILKNRGMLYGNIYLWN